MPSPTQSALSEDSLPANLFAARLPDLENNGYPNERSSVGKRDLTPFVRFLIILCIGVSAVLAWLASSHQQPSGLTPQAEPVSQNARDVSSQTASSPDQQQPNAVLDLDAVPQSVDRIAASITSNQGRMTSSVDRMATTQEQIARSVDQLRADQEQVTREITKLQEIEQSIRSKNSESSPRPASAPAPKPISQPASAPAPKPISQPASTPAPKPVSQPASTPAPRPVSRALQEPTVP